MAHISQIRRCYNCGVTLQCDDPSKTGYVTKEVFDNASQNFIFCNDCFEHERYHNISNEPTIDDDYIKMLNNAKKEEALIVYVVNLFSFESSFSHLINDVINNTNILVVGNKFDLMPSDVTEDEMKEYVAHRFRASGLSIDRNHVILTNAFTDENANNVLSKIYEMKNGKNVYIIGPKYSGKTTLISSFLRVYNNLSKGNIITKEYKDTHLKVMQIPINSKSIMYDTPGISINNSILCSVDKSTFRNIDITQKIIPSTITLKAGQVLYIGGLAFIEFLSGPKTEFTFFMHKNIAFKKGVNTKSDEKFVQLVSRKVLTPSYPLIKSIRDISAYQIEITESNMRDIGIHGLGWFTFEADKQILRIYVPKGISIYTSRPKVYLE